MPRLLMIIAACFQNLVCGGVIFGWAAISSGLLISSEGGPGLTLGKYRSSVVYKHILCKFFEALVLPKRKLVLVTGSRGKVCHIMILGE